MAKFEIDSADIEKLEESLSKLGNEAENTTNKVIHDFGYKAMERDVTKLLPIGARPNSRHAKSSKPFTKNIFNLGFDFKTKGGAAKNKNSFGYLIFPDEGRGKRNPREQNFTGRGTDVAKPKIIKELSEVITNKIQEVL